MLFNSNTKLEKYNMLNKYFKKKTIHHKKLTIQKFKIRYSKYI